MRLSKARVAAAWCWGAVSVALIGLLAASLPLELFVQRGANAVTFHGAGLRVERHTRSEADEFWIAAQDPTFLGFPRFSNFGGVIFASIPLWPLPAASALIAAWLWRRQRTARSREENGLCAACGYRLPSDGVAARCPECGLVDPGPARGGPPVPRRP